MSGAYIAVVTAFFVVNNHFLPATVVWLLPTLVGAPLVVRSLRSQRRGIPRQSSSPAVS